MPTLSTVLKLALFVWVSLVLGGQALAQPNADPYQVSSGFGNDGCRGQVSFDTSGSTPVQATSGVLQCFSGYGQLAASAGPGTLHASSEVHHSGFGTATGMGATARFHVPFQVTSNGTADVPVSMNLMLTGSVAVTVVNPATLLYTVFVRAHIDNTPLISGSQGSNGPGGTPLPALDGVTHLFTEAPVMVTPNVVHILEVEVEASPAVSEFDSSVTLDAVLTLPTTGPVFNVPAGVTVSNIPELNVVNNQWTTPQTPPNPGIAIDATTTQSFLDALANVPSSITMDHAVGRTTLNLPNLTNIGCALVVTNNPDLTTMSIPHLNHVGCEVNVSHNPSLDNVDLTVSGGIGGSATVEGNGGDIDLSVSGGIGGDLTATGNNEGDIDLMVSGDIGGDLSVTGNSGADAIGLSVGGIGGSLTVDDNSGASSIAITSIGGVGGDLSIKGNGGDVDANITGSVGGDLTVEGNGGDVDASVDSGVLGDISIKNNSGANRLDVSVGSGVGGSIGINNNSGVNSLDVSVGSGVGGSVDIKGNGDAEVTLHAPRVGGEVRIGGGSRPVHATTGDRGTTVTLTSGPATMTVALQEHTFTQGVTFSIQSLGAEPPSGGTDAASNPVIISPLTEYQFAFDIQTLNRDATLTFDVDVAALGAGAATFLQAVAANSATLAVRGDAPGSVFQSFDVCAGGGAPAAGGCVRVERFDAMGTPIPDGDPATPARVRFTGLTGHFSTWALVIVTHPDTTAPVISGVPDNISVTATSAAGAMVAYALPTAVDNHDGSVGVACVPASGSVFALGTTPVACTSSDTAGNTSHATFSVTVVPASSNHAPVNTVPGPQGTAINLPLLLSALSGNSISVSDVDTGTTTLRVTLTVTNGTLTLSGRSGLTFTNGNGIADVTTTFSGPIAKINAALDRMIYAPRLGFSGPASLTISTDDQGQSDTDVVAITVGARADLAVTMTASPDPVTLGSNLTYAMQVRNNGPLNATTVTVVDVLPAGVSFVSAIATQGACSYQSVIRTVRCDIGALANQLTAGVTLVVRPSQRKTLSNDAIVGANQSDANVTNNMAVVKTIVN